ncbi:MAG: right-handed parallel beta-helix repeat-containing protein, partial [Isosphaeraceae bacterium]
MIDRAWDRFSRRDVLKGGMGLGMMLAWQGRGSTARADEPPAVPVTNPKAISGDRIEPDWKEMFTISVGPKKGDLAGCTEKVIQAAVDQTAAHGGGTVKILPGTYRLRNAIYLPAHTRLTGTGPETILIKEPSSSTKLAASSDWYDQEVTLADARGFRVGDGVCFRAKNPDTGGPIVIKRTLVARSGNRFKLDKSLRENLWIEKGEPTAATLFPLLSAENVSDIVIENLTLDGNRANNENLDGNYAGCIFAQDCSRLMFRHVIARDNNGDGISWQICHDVRVENCQSHGHAGLGLHPGSGSQRPIMRHNQIRK